MVSPLGVDQDALNVPDLYISSGTLLPLVHVLELELLDRAGLDDFGEQLELLLLLLGLFGCRGGLCHGLLPEVEGGLLILTTASLGLLLLCSLLLILLLFDPRHDDLEDALVFELTGMKCLILPETLRMLPVFLLEQRG